MSFKKLIILLFLSTFTACGVKGPPTHKPGTEVPSFISPYLQDQSKKESDDDKKENSKQEKAKESK